MAVFQTFRKGTGTELNRIVSREAFLHLLEMEVKRSRRYQNFFCVLTLRLREIAGWGNGPAARGASLEKLTRVVAEEIRDSDIVGVLSEGALAVLLPYADAASGGCMRTRVENTLRYHDFQEGGYRVTVDQVCFPTDVTDSPELLRKLTGEERLTA